MKIKYRKGDIVNVRGTVAYDTDGVYDDTISVRLDGAYGDAYVKESSIKIVEYVFEPGDTVSWRVGEGINAGIVLAVKNGHAWISLENGDYCTRTTHSIERSENEDEA